MGTRRGEKSQELFLRKQTPTWSLLKAVWSVSKPSCSQASSSSLGKEGVIQRAGKGNPTCKCSPAPCSCSQRKELWVQLFCLVPSARHAPEDSTYLTFCQVRMILTWMNPLKGAKPVPGPIIITGVWGGENYHMCLGK